MAAGRSTVLRVTWEAKDCIMFLEWLLRTLLNAVIILSVAGARDHVDRDGGH
jgi:hypothetical protein